MCLFASLMIFFLSLAQNGQRWNTICSVFEKYKDMKSINEFLAMVKSYNKNPMYTQRFNALYAFLGNTKDDESDEGGPHKFFNIATTFLRGIPLHERGENTALSMSQN